MTKDPAVLLYTSDFLSGIAFLSMEQRGQYITLLCQQHQLGDIPENHMINICNSLDSPVIKKFIKNEEGHYYNKRMREEAEKRKTFCLSRSNNKSGRKKKEEKEITSKSYDNHKIIHMDNDNINSIINYLNKICNTNYKTTTQSTKTLINARAKDGFTVTDFYLVIDKKFKEWNNTEQSKFLRPETLFGSKFESYLNQKNNLPLQTETPKQINPGAKNEYRSATIDDLYLIRGAK